jgi:hypothetical protein
MKLLQIGDAFGVFYRNFFIASAKHFIISFIASLEPMQVSMDRGFLFKFIISDWWPAYTVLEYSNLSLQKHFFIPKVLIILFTVILLL